MLINRTGEENKGRKMLESQSITSLSLSLVAGVPRFYFQEGKNTIHFIFLLLKLGSEYSLSISLCKLKQRAGIYKVVILISSSRAEILNLIREFEFFVWWGKENAPLVTAFYFAKSQK